MKKFTFLLFMLCQLAIKAQFITVPDSQFAHQLRISTGCMVGNQLDTICAATAPILSLGLSVSHIHDLTGIQYFHNLESVDGCCEEINHVPALPPNLSYLNLNGNHIATLPALPATLLHLDCFGNQLTSLPPLPPGLTYLNCGINQLSSLPALPNSLDHLECGDNPISVLPALPTKMTYLDCGGPLITVLPTLPDSLLVLLCGGPNLTTLPALPGSLVSILCQYSSLTNLPPLPSSLKILRLNKNQLSVLPPLPAGLRVLECAYNHLTTLPELPDTLTELWCSNNPLTCLPKLKTIVDQFFFDSTEITCVPNYQYVRSSYPLLSSFPLCTDSLNTTCNLYWNIAGKVFYDVNNTCLRDSGDKNQLGIRLNLFHNGIPEDSAFTDQGGNYSFDISVFGSYTVSLDSSYGHVTTCPDSGYYTIQITPSDSLAAGINFSMDTNIYSKIALIGAEPFFKLFPNPATNSAEVEIDENMASGWLTISDLTGQKISHLQINANHLRLNTANLENGVYLVTAETQKGRITKKLVIEK